MPDDPVPSLPNDQGLPDRPFPYTPTNANVTFVRCDPIEGSPEPVIALVYDSPDTRTVSYWLESAFLTMAQRMVAFVAEGAQGLTVADMDDLRKIKDVSPFMDTP